MQQIIADHYCVSGNVLVKQQDSLEVFPSSDPERISINVSLRGATPEDVERGITIRIEEAIADLEGIERLRSRSSEGSASVTIDVEDGYDPREMLADVKTLVDAINTFPIDAEKPNIRLAQWQQDVITVAIGSEYGRKKKYVNLQNAYVTIYCD